MAKRKNPLKSLDDFLKQEATSFVTPAKVTTAEEQPPVATAGPDTAAAQELTLPKEHILVALQTLAKREGDEFRSSFYNIIRETLENLESSTAEDKMLINTLLYLNNKADWRNNIRNYWSKESA